MHTDGRPGGSDASDAADAERVDAGPTVAAPTTVTRLADRAPALLALGVVTALALLARLVGLGARIFHWDEGRVGYWILRFRETGEFSYRPIIHGPFLPVVNDHVFALLGPSDFAARLVVALVGGLLPLAAWLFRDYLDDAEVVAFGLLLAANPLLVYYSRFMRNDVLVAAFSLVALGFVLRGVAAGRAWYLYPAAASLAMGFAAKENAIIYVACYAGAAALLVDHRLVRAGASGRPIGSVLFREWPRAVAARLRSWRGSVARGLGFALLHAVGAFAVFVLVFCFFYAPRPDLWNVLSAPATLPRVFEAGTVDAAGRFYETWVSGTHQSHDYLPYLYDYLETLVYGAPAVLIFGVIGAVGGRYSLDGDRFRDLVAFGTYWGVASIVGYPIATDIQAPWVVVHAVVPLALPAAVGVAIAYRTARSAFESADTVGVALAALLLVAAVGGVAAANVDYANSAAEEDKQVLQWAQPANDLKPTVQRVERISRANEGTDVLFYGTRDPNSDQVRLYVEDESSALSPPPGGPAWHSRLPLPWYLERSGATVTSTDPETPPAEALENPPPVVVAFAYDRAEVAAHLDGYTAHEHAFKLWGERIVVFVDDDAPEAAA